MEENLEKRALTGTLWIFSERLSLEAFRFFTTIILARYLGPSEFGLVALTTIFIAISLTFIDSGFTKALIQKKNTTTIDESTVFYFNLFVSILFIVIINAIASTAAIYYKEPRIENILRALSINLLLFAFRQIQQVILTKELNFKLQYKANVVGTVVSGLVGLILAYSGFGVWAVIVQFILDSLIKTIMFWVVSSWRPVFVFSIDSFKQLYKFGLNLFINDLLKNISENIYGFLIGKYYTPYTLGLYDRGNKLASLIITNFQFSIQKITLPLFSKLQDDKAMLKNTAKKTLEMIMYLVVPSMTVLAIAAKPLTMILLSNEWIEIVPYIQLFCLYWVFFPFSGVNNHLVLALGHSNIILKQSVIIYGIQVIILLATLKFGIFIIIIGQIISTLIRQFVLIYYASILINFGLKEQLNIFFKHIALSAITISPLYFINYLEINYYLKLASQSILGIILYMYASYKFKYPSVSIYLKYIPDNLKFKANVNFS